MQGTKYIYPSYHLDIIKLMMKQCKINFLSIKSLTILFFLGIMPTSDTGKNYQRNQHTLCLEAILKMILSHAEPVEGWCNISHVRLRQVALYAMLKTAQYATAPKALTQSDSNECF